MSRIVSATAATGHIISAVPFEPNMSYSLEFHGPCVLCDKGSSSDTEVMADLFNSSLTEYLKMPLSVYQIKPHFFAFGPDAYSPQRMIPWSTAANITSYDNIHLSDLNVSISSPTSALSSGGYNDYGSFNYAPFSSNQLWVLYPNQSFPDSLYSISNPVNASAFQSFVCKMYNASYRADVKYENGVQSIQETHREVLNYVDMPNMLQVHKLTTSLDNVAGLDQSILSYSGFMQAFINIMQGILAYTKNGAWVNSGILQSSLIGSSDLVPVMEAMFNESGSSSALDSFLQESVRQARNVTLGLLLEELAHNITYSLLSDQVLAYVSCPIFLKPVDP